VRGKEGAGGKVPMGEEEANGQLGDITAHLQKRKGGKEEIYL